MKSYLLSFIFSGVVNLLLPYRRTRATRTERKFHSEINQIGFLVIDQNKTLNVMILL